MAAENVARRRSEVVVFLQLPHDDCVDQGAVTEICRKKVMQGINWTRLRGKTNPIEMAR